MDYDEMRRRFTETINVVIETKRDDNKSFLNANEYGNRIAEVKEAKILLSTPGIGRSPYEAMFGCRVKIGLASACVPHDEINRLVTEEDVEHLLKEMEGESNDLEKPNLHIEIEESRVELEVDNVTVDAGQLTEYRCENRIVCGQCSTVLLFGENVNNDGKCLKCERQENIVNERKRSRESLDKQAAKMLKLSNQKFDRKTLLMSVKDRENL
ncbi:hypothetical protein QE152_g5240 [Popillia japonica]|uniref:Uncharacterized protein n=1 Tax=Popillia japonica TaxID=7064 RepID=A0AAW1MPQ8_POPJA